MIKLIKANLALGIILTFSSCLDHGLEELPAFEDAEITSVSLVEHRYISNDVSPYNDQPVIKFVTLSHSTNIDSDNGKVEIDVELPSSFPAEELENVSAASLVVAIGLSTAATITPTENSAHFGVPGDWRETNTYLVRAADGTTKNWSVALSFNK